MKMGDLIEVFVDEERKINANNKILKEELVYLIERESEVEEHEILNALKPTEKAKELLIQVISYSIDEDKSLFYAKMESTLKSYCKEARKDVEIASEWYKELRSANIFLNSYPVKSQMKAILNMKIAKDRKSEVEHVVRYFKEESQRVLNSSNKHTDRVVSLKDFTS